LQKSLKEKTLNDYNDAINTFCHDNKDLTIYLAGEISHPGISDLDFLVVDHKPVINKEVKLFLAGGNVIIVPSFLMEKVRDFENLNLKLLQGEKFKIKSPKRHFKYIEIIEWLPERILKLQSLRIKNYTKQELQLLHKSVFRSVEAVSSLTKTENNLITVDEVRNNCKLIDQNVLKEAIYHAGKSWDVFESYVFDNKLLGGDVKGSVNISSYYNFCDKFKCLMLYFKSMNNIKENSLSISLQRASNISGNSYMNKDFESYAINRWEDLNRLFLWFNEKKLKRGMIKYGWFL